ncbi:hypothetical protein [Piscirickettsia litoralis]|uniref:Uncharacterized protein n=1 Tax=Piscirickettsia litoralis TaxID=1891921 RepID=A0ABX3A474_9GAMM|nr:hypothetical protein [Piscirickettsia litoralis]ODN42458.1 hypothetical protein BGC07_05320 [Piscirickettsia litoralis]
MMSMLNTKKNSNWNPIYRKNSSSRKTQALLKFCSPNKGKQKEDSLIKNYILLTCFDRSSKEYKSDTSAAEALIKKINSSELEIKTSFYKALNVSSESEVTAKHLDQFISKHSGKTFNYKSKAIFYKEITNPKIERSDYQVLI